MGEGMRTLAVLVWALCAVNSNSYAQGNGMIIGEESAAGAPTIVYGAAKKADGKSDRVIIEQPEDAPNPLGNPIPVNQPPEVIGGDNPAPVQVKGAVQNDNMAPDPQGVPLPAAGPQGIPVTANQPVVPGSPQEAVELGKQFQNTLVEGNGMIYDIQAYPTEDLKVLSNPANPQTIYSPNVNP